MKKLRKLNYAKLLIKQDGVKEISPTLYLIGKNSIQIEKKKGRTLWHCNCKNDTLYCRESPMCHHKQALSIYLNNGDFLEKLDKVIKEYENCKKLKLPVSIDYMLKDLKDMRGIFLT